MHFRLLSLMALALLTVTFLAGCDDDEHHHTPIVYIQDGVLYNTPPGGVDFGDAFVFDTLYSEQGISDIDDADGFDFVIQEASFLVISVESFDGLNPLVELYDTAGNFVASDDDSGIGSDSLLVGNVNPGLYTVVVWASLSGPATVGDYGITILVGDDNGGDFEEVAINESASVTNNTLASAGGSATWIVTLPTPGSVTVTITQTSGNADIALQVIDQRGNEVALLDPPGIADPAYVSQNLPRGTYLLVLLNGDASPAGTYDIGVSVAPQGAP